VLLVAYGVGNGSFDSSPTVPPMQGDGSPPLAKGNDKLEPFGTSAVLDSDSCSRPAT